MSKRVIVTGEEGTIVCNKPEHATTRQDHCVEHTRTTNAREKLFSCDNCSYSTTRKCDLITTSKIVFL